MNDKNGDNTRFANKILYDKDDNRDRTYAEPDDPTVYNAHDHLKDIIFLFTIR